MQQAITAFILGAILLVGGCSVPVTDPAMDSTEGRKAHFNGREIDLGPYVEGFPYSSFHPYYDAEKLFYMKSGEITELLELPLTGQPDLRNGKPISTIDFSTRNVWNISYNDADKHLYWTGDERNDEVINLTRLDPETGTVEKLTDVPYIFGWKWNEAKDKAAYIARLGDKANRLGEVRLLDLKTGEEQAIIQDKADMRFTWGAPSWQPEGKGVVVNALRDADRSYGNLMYIDFEKGTSTLLTDPSKRRSFPYTYPEWLDENTFLYFSNESGYNNVYYYDLLDKKTGPITEFTQDVGEIELLTIEGEQYLFVVTSSFIQNELYLIDLETGKPILQKSVEFGVGIMDLKDNKMMVSISSNAAMFRIDELTVTLDTFAFQPLIDVPEDLKKRVYHAVPSRITFPTFDTDPATGEARQLHAYLYTPKNPLPKDQQMVMIQSFYGGGNSFSTRTQILAEAGIHVLSPSPRGSRGFGQEFAALNDKDLGGDEIVDVIYAARYISEKLGIPPSRVGVYGGSHGGYATMRSLTFPPETNGRNESFDWGFGVSHAGFSDIIHFYENCNIPDWVTLEAGDPKTEADKLRDRSPLYHADKMKGKLLLTHGTNDNRVPIAGSRMMADSLKKYGKDVTLVEFEGQGHGIKGLDNTVRIYQVWFDFLETINK